jgi:hypothetical protein
VGIDLAIQDAVAAANLLAGPLKKKQITEAVLAAVQRRRAFPTRATQAIQIVAHRGMARVFENPGPIHAPWQMRAVQRIPGIHRALGYAVGVGARPEHVREEPGERPRRAGSAGLVCAAIGGVAAAVVCAWAVWKVWRKVAVAASQGG